jgi:hypothetical protein
MERCDSLTNEQITDVVGAFAKAEVPEVKLLDEIEDLIIETLVPFSVKFLYKLKKRKYYLFLSGDDLIKKIKN